MNGLDGMQRNGERQNTTPEEGGISGEFLSHFGSAIRGTFFGSTVNLEFID